MTNYSDNPAMVRVDFFKQSGKWYTTEEMLFLSYTENIHHTFMESLNTAFPGRFNGMRAVCLEPYHENAYPLMITK